MCRILKTLEQAKPSELKEGLRWYSEALLFAKSLDPDVRKSSGVIAALSPRQKWDTNKRSASRLLRDYSLNKTYSSVAGTYRNVHKAWRIASGEDPEIVLHSSRPTRWLKVPRFYKNILGNKELVTVDVWTARVAVPYPPDSVSGLLYLQIEDMYQKASLKADMSPRDLQAVCWVVSRRTWNQN